MKKNINEAIKAMNNSYSPYSKFKVGAVLELTNGKLIYGTNVENASFGLSNCAERSALFSAYSQGYKKEDIKSITIIADDKVAVSPCGACRQVMHELLPDHADIILANLKGDVKKFTKDELLPYAFVLEKDEQ